MIAFSVRRDLRGGVRVERSDAEDTVCGCAMTWDDYVCLGVLVLWLLAALQGAGAFLRGLRFHRRVHEALVRAGDQQDERGRFRFQPKAAVIMPCCGVDEKLEQTVLALGRQRYERYEVIFALESAQDPAYTAIGGWTENQTSPPSRRVVAGLAERRSQKIHNLTAAIAEVPEDCEVLVFADSDAVPGEDWLGHLIAPLQDESVGATTGYRWYTAAGGLAAGIRSVWNAATVTTLDDERLNFCWGGATAISRRTFERIGVPRLWENSVSDDLSLTVALRRAGLRIRFVPQAMVSSSDATTLRAFWAFARRQLVITRVYMPGIWVAGFTLCLNLIIGAAAAAALFFASALGWLGSARVMVAALAGWITILALVAGRSVLPQLAVRKVLSSRGWSWRDFWWDIGGISFAGPLHLMLMLSSLTSRRFVWRNTMYELVSPDETRILGRVTPV
ncbi:MAG TPA: glycosyltransferase family 2 protein [Phycisphaerae bacterium]|nr:glycosyltransferase family 2 protein [Phycisphaerae bacterium]